MHLFRQLTCLCALVSLVSCAGKKQVLLESPSTPSFDIEWHGIPDGELLVIACNGKEVFRGPVKMPDAWQVLGKGFRVGVRTEVGIREHRVAIALPDNGFEGELLLDYNQGNMVDVRVKVRDQTMTHNQWQGKGRVYE